jgi:hypothetical protein
MKEGGRTWVGLLLFQNTPSSTSYDIRIPTNIQIICSNEYLSRRRLYSTLSFHMLARCISLAERKPRCPHLGDAATRSASAACDCDWAIARGVLPGSSLPTRDSLWTSECPLSDNRPLGQETTSPRIDFRQRLRSLGTIFLTPAIGRAP